MANEGFSYNIGIHTLWQISSYTTEYSVLFEILPLLCFPPDITYQYETLFDMWNLLGEA